MRKFLCSALFPVFLVATASGSNLIVNGDFTGGNANFTSDYTYVAPPGKTYDEGTYQITSNATHAHEAWTNPGPHSGTQFLVANGSQNINLSPWIQTLQIAPQDIQVSTAQDPVYYRFQAYISSVYPDNPPRLSFEMSLNNSGIWQTLTTSLAPSQTGVWYLTYKDGWFGSEPTSISFRLRNAESAAGGNDFGIDSIFFGLSADAPGFPDHPIDSTGEITGIPEPSTLILVFLGFATALYLRRRQQGEVEGNPPAKGAVENS